MGFRKDAWASVWSVEEGRGNTLKVRISTSRKNRETEEYEQDFSGFCTFIGTAKAKAEKLKPKDRIKLGDVDVTTWYNKEKGVEYVTYKVFDFETSGSGTTDKPADTKKTAKNTKGKQKSSGLEDEVEDGEVDEDNLPF